MSKIHVLVPYTTQVACGSPSHYINPSYREQVTCKACKQTQFYKDLPSIPRRLRK
jgi:hypothetical protein